MRSSANVKIATINSATLKVRAGIGGEPIVDNMQACGALAFQSAPWGVWLVNSPSHPEGGDHLDVKITVGVGCCLDVRSFSPTIARSGNEAARLRMGRPPSSSTHTTVSVASDGVLGWCPEPGVATNSCDHLNESVVQLASNARLAWREDYLLDRRTGVRLGTWRSRLRIVRDGWPVLVCEQTLGPGSSLWESPVVLEGARAVSTFVVIDPSQDPSVWSPARATGASATGISLPLAGPGIQITAWGDDLVECRDLAERMFAAAGVPAWAQARWAAASHTRTLEHDHSR
jgi:urease accessory protein UreH